MGWGSCDLVSRENAVGLRLRRKQPAPVSNVGDKEIQLLIEFRERWVWIAAEEGF